MAEDLNALSNEDFRARWRTWLHANFPQEWRTPMLESLGRSQADYRAVRDTVLAAVKGKAPAPAFGRP